MDNIYMHKKFKYINHEERKAPKEKENVNLKGNSNFYITFDILTTYMQTKSPIIQIDNNTTSIRADVVLNDEYFTNLFGQVKDIYGNLAKNVRVILLKPSYENSKIEYIPISVTKTDSNGFFYFNIDKYEKDLEYRVIVT